MKWNGKPVRPEDLEKEMKKWLEQGTVELVTRELRERLSAIRHPETGEFPTVVVLERSLAKYAFRVEGSAQLRTLVLERLSTEERNLVEFQADPAGTPRAFLSYTGKDREVAARIAKAFQSKGIDTWWAGWSLDGGQSLRQEIDKGLNVCTHFVVLLTPDSVERPWVKEEMDAGLILHVEGQAKFIPLRKGLSAEQLPPLLRGKVSPSLDEDFEGTLQQLINNIHGITQKPPLGTPPLVVAADTGYSKTANALAKIFVERSEHALFGDPQIPMEDLVKETGLTEDDIVDAIHELRPMMRETFGAVRAVGELFATFDGHWKEWTPADDALRIASDLIHDATLPSVVSEIAARYEWPARRMNAAIAYLNSRGLILDHKTTSAFPWGMHWLTKNEATRRFVRSRS